MTTIPMENEAIQNALRRLCLSFISIDELNQFQKNGISDVDLESIFRKQEAHSGGSGGPGWLWMNYWVNKTEIKVWIGETPSTRGKPTYQGKKLLFAVRQALALPYPDGTRQETFIWRES